MKFVKAVPVLAFCVLSACDELPNVDLGGFGLGAEPTLPEGVLALVGPNQDLTTARLLETDNCYWYDHRNAVETTPLPLLSKTGRQICVKPKTG